MPTYNAFEIYFSTQNLRLAYQRITYWPERLVKDRTGLYAFGEDLEVNLENLSRQLLDGKYMPQKPFKYFEPKSSGTQRTKTVLMIEDALVYQAIANIIAEKNYHLLEAHKNFIFGSVLMPETRLGTKLFHEKSPKFYFFKFWRALFRDFKDSVIKAIEQDKASHKFETDITGFFDSIPHYNLLMIMSKYFGIEDDILDLLSVCLNFWSGTKYSSTPGVGIPQGPQPSYLLANLMLYPLDKQVISEGHKYYRYMDDIHIYGYSEAELRNVLVTIDNYLKGHGLSINSKKTGITRIGDVAEDATVRELKRLETLGEEYAGDEGTSVAAITDEGLLSRPEIPDIAEVPVFSGMIPAIFVKSKHHIISKPEEIVAFWEKEIREVEAELPDLFIPDQKELTIKEETDDIDFIRLSARYGHAMEALSDLKPAVANNDLLPYWMFAFRNYVWRASNFSLTLRYYNGNEVLKESLLKLYNSEKNYELFRYYIVQCLAYNFSFTDRELRAFFQFIPHEASEIVRQALYCLILRHSDDQQLITSLNEYVVAEPHPYIRRNTLDFWRRQAKVAVNLQAILDNPSN